MTHEPVGVAIIGTVVGPLQAQAQDIVDTAVAAGPFNTLATAIPAAGLIDTLKGKGPFTVFAPTDAAFAKLPARTSRTARAREQAEADRHPHLLRRPGNDGRRRRQAQGREDRQRRLDQAPTAMKVEPGDGRQRQGLKADIVATNGVIHVIDTVMLPK